MRRSRALPGAAAGCPATSTALPYARGASRQRAWRAWTVPTLWSRAERGRIGGPQFRKQGFVGRLRFAKRAPLLQRPRFVERRRRAMRCARQQENQAQTDRAESHRRESSRRGGHTSSAQGDASAGRTGVTELSLSFPLSPSIWTGTVAVSAKTLPALGITPGKSSETSRETLVRAGSASEADATTEPASNRSTDTIESAGSGFCRESPKNVPLVVAANTALDSGWTGKIASVAASRGLALLPRSVARR